MTERPRSWPQSSGDRSAEAVQGNQSTKQCPPARCQPYLGRSVVICWSDVRDVASIKLGVSQHRVAKNRPCWTAPRCIFVRSSKTSQDQFLGTEIEACTGGVEARRGDIRELILPLRRRPLRSFSIDQCRFGEGMTRELRQRPRPQGCFGFGMSPDAQQGIPWGQPTG